MKAYKSLNTSDNKKGENYMKKLLTITLTVLLAMLIIVSCSPDTQNVEENLAIVSFNADEKQTRSLSRTNQVLNPDEYYWYYTAVKADTNGLKSGEKTTETEVKEGQGLSGVNVGPFSYGKWTFTLYGYKEEKQKLVYKGTATILINQTYNTLPVTVQAQSTAGGEGYLEFPAKGAIPMTGTGVTFDATKFTEEIRIVPTTEITGQSTVTAYDKAADSGKTTRTFILKSGSYSVTVSYLEGGTLSEDKSSYTGGYAVASDTIYVTVTDYLTTVISGDIEESTGVIEEIDAEGYVVQKAEKTSTIETGADSLKISVAASPATITKTDSSSGSKTATGETSVSVPKNLVANTELSSAKLSVTSYSQESATKKKPSFTITEETTASGGESQKTTTTTTKATVLGGLDIDLYVNEATTETSEFADNQVLTITTYILPGLNNNTDYDANTAGSSCNIVVKYDNAEGENKADGTVIAYDAETGELTFTVNHLSSYYIAAKNTPVYNSTKGRSYENLEAAISAATEGDTLILFDCSLSNSISDEALSSYTWEVSHGNCADEASGFLHEKSDYFYGGYGTKVEPYLIANRDQFKNIDENSWGVGYGYYKWYKTNDTLDGSDWPTIDICGSFDGNGLTVNKLDSCLFRYVYNNGTVKQKPSEDLINTYYVKNLTINADIISAGSVSAVIYEIDAYNFVMENVTVHGSISGSTHVASFVTFGPANYENGYQYDSKITFKNCHSDATVRSADGPATGFYAHPMMKSSEGTITLMDSDFTGTLVSTNSDGYKYVCGNDTKATITDNKDASTFYDKTVNGWKYNGETKFVEPTNVSISTLSYSLGGAISEKVAGNASVATVALVISPGPGCYTATYESEILQPLNGYFTSTKVKYFEIRLNPNGGAKSGANDNFYDVNWFSQLDADTIIRFAQYDKEGNLLNVTNISLGDKTPAENS